jgi:hypothetical protein
MRSPSAGCRFDLCADLVGPSAPPTLSHYVRSLMITSFERWVSAGTPVDPAAAGR